MAPSGTVWSFVVYHRAFAAELKDEIPYTVLMVELDDGPYVIGRFVEDGSKPTIGDRVTTDFAEIGGVPSVRSNAAMSPDDITDRAVTRARRLAALGLTPQPKMKTMITSNARVAPPNSPVPPSRGPTR